MSNPIMAIHAQNVLQQYHNKQVLQLSATFRQEQITAILGANGSGKSTLLRILGLLEAPAKGDVTIVEPQKEWINPFENPVLQRRITLVPTNSILFQGTIQRNLSYGLKIRRYKSSLIRERVAQALETVGLADKAKSEARNLSSGEKQRVAIARALALDPEVLLLDEPTASLDPKNTAIIETALMEWQRRTKRILVVVTHNLFQAKHLSDSLLLLHDGQVAENTATNTFFQEPQSEIGRRFLEGSLY